MKHISVCKWLTVRSLSHSEHARSLLNLVAEFVWTIKRIVTSTETLLLRSAFTLGQRSSKTYFHDPLKQFLKWLTVRTEP